MTAASRRKKLSLWGDLAPLQKELERFPANDSLASVKTSISQNLKRLPGIVGQDPNLVEDNHPHDRCSLRKLVS